MEEKTLIVPCECGSCGLIKFSGFDYDDSKDVMLEYFGSTFYEKQDGIFRTLIHRIKFAWSIMTGKEYSLYDVLISKEYAKKLYQFLGEYLGDDK